MNCNSGAAFAHDVRAGLTDRNVPFLWTNIRYGGNDGFVRCPARERQPFNLWSSCQLGGGWWFIEEDCAVSAA